MKHEIKGNWVILSDCWTYLEKIRAIPGRKYDPNTKRWAVPYNLDSVHQINILLNLKLPSPIVGKAAAEISGHTSLTGDFVIKHLYHHQQDSVNVGRAQHYFADLSEPGTGKTLVQIELLAERKSWPALIICPKSIMHEVWEKQLSENGYGCIVLEGGSAKIKKKLESMPVNVTTIFVVNYDIVAGILLDLLRIKWQIIILDESTKIKSPSAQRSKAIMKLRDSAKYRSIMTGTIAPNNLLDVFNQIKFVDPSIFGDLYYAFRQRYFYPGGYQNYEWFPRPEAMPIIHERLKLIAVQHKKRDCLDLPPLVHEVRRVELTGEQDDLYEQMRDEFMLYLKNTKEPITAPFVITRLMKLRQICSGFVYYDEGDGRRRAEGFNTNKLGELEDILEQLGDQKAIIFCHFNQTIARLGPYLACEIAVTIYDGTMNNHEKKKSLDYFSGTGARLLIANPASAGHGLNLQFCSNIIYYEHDFNLENYLQSMQRIERIGQKNKMTVYHILCKDTIEEYIYKRLNSKIDINKKLDIEELKREI
jgi:SNF2 family DNA or RNA helicase